jgi:hypothetical protein
LPLGNFQFHEDLALIRGGLCKPLKSAVAKCLRKVLPQQVLNCLVRDVQVERDGHTGQNKER